MLIYHNTNVVPENILKEGLCCHWKSEGTEAINQILNLLEDHPNWLDRNYCLFFYLKEKADFGDYVVAVEIDQLKKDGLFVADEGCAQEIFNAIYYGNEELYKDLARKYWDSVTRLEEYLQRNQPYQNPEILYLYDIFPRQIHSVKEAL